MRPRERWQAVLRGEGLDRPTCDFWGTGETIQRLLGDLGCNSERALWERLGVDKSIHLSPKHPDATEDTWHIQSLFSIWGVKTQEISYGDELGTYLEDVEHPLADAESVAELERFAWPDPNDWDFSDYRRRCVEWDGYPVIACSYEPFYLYCRLRGMEQALQDLVLNPSVVEAVMERTYYIHESIIRRALEEAAGSIDCVYVAEDLGMQDTLLMSPSAFRRFVKPWLARMIELAHSFDVKVLFHSDGAIRPVLPDLIEIGIDILNPIQWRCRGMDREQLARDFGRDVVFHGGVDNQQTLPYGTPEDVRREVRDNLALLGKGRGYIVAPCHNIQANTPTENVVALYDAVHEAGGVSRDNGRSK